MYVSISEYDFTVGTDGREHIAATARAGFHRTVTGLTSSLGTFSVARRARDSSMAFATFALGMRLGLQGGPGRIPGRAFHGVPAPSAHGMEAVGGGKVSR